MSPDRRSVVAAGVPGEILYTVDPDQGWTIDGPDGPVEVPTLCVEVHRDDGVQIDLRVAPFPGHLDDHGTKISDDGLRLVEVTIGSRWGGEIDLAEILPRLDWRAIVTVALIDWAGEENPDARPDPKAVRLALALVGHRPSPHGGRMRDDDLPLVAEVWRTGGAKAVEERFVVSNRTAYRLADRCVAVGLLTAEERGTASRAKSRKSNPRRTSK